jgi:hypothetical protein
MKRMKVSYYSVTGSGAFPLDMLRYDQAWPVTQEAVLGVEGRVRGQGGHPRTVQLASHYPPTPARWQSFGWTVSDE